MPVAESAGKLAGKVVLVGISIIISISIVNISIIVIIIINHCYHENHYFDKVAVVTASTEGIG